MNDAPLIYYTSANTCEGYVSFLPQHLSQQSKSVFLKNAGKSLKKNIFRQISDCFKDSNAAVQTILSPGSVFSPCGIIVPGAQIAIASEDVNTDAPEFSDITADALQCIKRSAPAYSELEKHAESKRLNEKNMFLHLAEAKKIHDTWEEIYISNMDFSAADSAEERLISTLFKGIHHIDGGENIDRFFGSMTPSISVNYIDALTRGFKKRIFIKGRPGTGKSTFLKKVRDAALDAGYDTETYHCSFDPQSLDMVAVRAAGICVFDSTSPHELFPVFETDSIFDIYKIAVAPDTDELYSAALSDIKVRYDTEINIAKTFLKEAVFNKNEIDRIYSELTDKEAEISFIRGIMKYLDLI